MGAHPDPLPPADPGPRLPPSLVAFTALTLLAVLASGVLLLRGNESARPTATAVTGGAHPDPAPLEIMTGRERGGLAEALDDLRAASEVRAESSAVSEGRKHPVHGDGAGAAMDVSGEPPP